MFERLPTPELVETKSTPSETTTGVSLLSLLSTPSSLDTSTVTSYSSTIMTESTVSSTSAVQTTTPLTNEELMTTTSALADVATSSAAEAAAHGKAKYLEFPGVHQNNIANVVHTPSTPEVCGGFMG